MLTQLKKKNNNNNNNNNTLLIIRVKKYVILKLGLSQTARLGYTAVVFVVVLGTSRRIFHMEDPSSWGKNIGPDYFVASMVADRCFSVIHG